MSSPRLPLIAVIIAAAALGGSASAQLFPGGPPGGGSGPGNLLERVAFGAVEDVNPIRGYLQVQVPGRGSRIVVVAPSTKVTRMTPIPPSELKIGDEVTVSGTPTVVAADKVRLGRPMGMAELIGALQGGAKPPAEQPSPTPQSGEQPAAAPPTLVAPMPPPMPPSRPSPSYTLSGSVKSVTPLVVTTGEGVDVAVVIPAGGSILRRRDGDLSAAVVGEDVVALGDVNDDGYLAAIEVHLGESISLGRLGFGTGAGGPMMGGPRGSAVRPATGRQE